ncbi:uncharacterized protein BCR38DRAFT_407365 [Pseudomassariella vexata]|uniref:Uncharacterized protein n=1 Tax=Pseudomassariella vexata TaxID=1141098 RepID=A0A1Y2E7X5_9PEZI|nr:uncharacterized protein BCR38DRAFT_407365 [Pseudomassariella vexata]ORY67386.1 hypothetical protein BCR38DRAFT_407365 [Pseudomassariella vexata]
MAGPPPLPHPILERYCGADLSPGVRKPSANNCTTPCTGDPKLSCAGQDALAIYNIPATSHKKTPDEDDSTSTRPSPTQQRSQHPAPTRQPAYSSSPLLLEAYSLSAQ